MKTLLAVAHAALLGLVWTAPLAAQAGPLASQSMRPYRYVFFAYALAWLLVFGWVVSVSRKLARLERSAEDQPR